MANPRAVAPSTCHGWYCIGLLWLNSLDWLLRSTTSTTTSKQQCWWCWQCRWQQRQRRQRQGWRQQWQQQQRWHGQQWRRQQWLPQRWCQQWRRQQWDDNNAMATTTMEQQQSDGDGLASAVPPIWSNNQLMLTVWGGVNKREGRYWGTEGQKRVKVEAIGWRSLHLHSINSKSTFRTPQSGKHMGSYFACVLGVKLRYRCTMVSMFIDNEKEDC